MVGGGGRECGGLRGDGAVRRDGVGGLGWRDEAGVVRVRLFVVRVEVGRAAGAAERRRGLEEAGRLGRRRFVEEVGRSAAICKRVSRVVVAAETGRALCENLMTAAGFFGVGAVGRRGRRGAGGAGSGGAEMNVVVGGAWTGLLRGFRSGQRI